MKPRNGRIYKVVRPVPEATPVVAAAVVEQPVPDDDEDVVDETVPTLYMYDIFGEDWLGGISARRVIADLEQLAGVDEIAVRINSPGGDVFEGVAIHNALARFPGRVVVHVDGLAASIASIVALAGDEVRIAENAMFMTHRPWTISIGDAVEMRHVAGMLDRIWSALLATYETRTGLRAAVIEQRVIDGGGEWWMTAAESVSEGFADQVETGDGEAKIFGLERFRHAPAAAAALADPEHLRFSVAAARSIEIARPRVERSLRGADPGPSREHRRRMLDVLRLGG